MKENETDDYRAQATEKPGGLEPFGRGSAPEGGYGALKEREGKEKKMKGEKIKATLRIGMGIWRIGLLLM